MFGLENEQKLNFTKSIIKISFSISEILKTILQITIRSNESSYSRLKNI